MDFVVCGLVVILLVLSWIAWKWLEMRNLLKFV